MDKNHIFNYIDTPQVTFNGYMSITRNVYLTSSIGIALLTFSRNFKEHINIMRIIAIGILLYSIIYGIKGSRDFYIYLNFLETVDDLPSFLRERINRWYIWIFFTNIYTLITIFLFSFIFFKKILT